MDEGECKETNPISDLLPTLYFFIILLYVVQSYIVCDNVNRRTVAVFRKLDELLTNRVLIRPMR